MSIVEILSTKERMEERARETTKRTINVSVISGCVESTRDGYPVLRHEFSSRRARLIMLEMPLSCASDRHIDVHALSARVKLPRNFTDAKKLHVLFRMEYEKVKYGGLRSTLRRVVARCLLFDIGSI